MAFYITTPIYYVNDRPHIGHIYSTVVADVLARFHRQRGQTAILSTGTDEHAVKVAEAAAKHGREVGTFAAEHATDFRDTFRRFGIGFDDFIRTSEPRHVEEVASACQRLLETGDIYLGRFEGWYDSVQEEYVTDTKAEAARYVGTNGQRLVRRDEENYFFRLSRFRDRVAEAIQTGELEVTPAARRAEVSSRLVEPLRDVPISRKTEHDWGVLVPGTTDHRVYVWIDALLNYRTVARTAGLSSVWPPSLHLIGKEILWFHAVLWPALLFALRDAGDRAAYLPRRIHAHSHWTRDGTKISKSLGNAVTASELLNLADGPTGVDCVRYFFAARGPIGAADSDFSGEEFTRLYNSQLANGLGNGISRILGLLDRYFERRVPEAGPDSAHDQELRRLAYECDKKAREAIDAVDLASFVESATVLIHRVNRLIQETEPYKLAKADTGRQSAASILRVSLEAALFAVELLAPVLPKTAARVRAAVGAGEQPAAPSWGRLEAGHIIGELGGLFPRIASTRWPQPCSMPRPFRPL